MKQYIKTFIITLCTCLFIVSCNDNDDNVKGGFEIIASQTTFLAIGGAGTIKYASSPQEAEVNASIAADWCKVTRIDNGIISLQAEPNSLTEGRNTIIKISQGEQAYEIPVSQYGSTFYLQGIKSNEFELYVSEKSEIRVKCHSDFPIYVETESQFITAITEDKDNEIIFTISESTTPREGTATIWCTYPDGRKESLELIFKQTLFQFKDLLGEWELSYYLNNETERRTATVILEDGGNEESFIMKNFPKYTYTDEGITYYINGPLKMVFDTETQDVIIPNNQKLTDDDLGQTVFFQVHNRNTYYVHSSKDYGYRGTFSLQEYKATYTFEHDGPEWDKGPVNGFRVMLRKNDSPYSDIVRWWWLFMSEYVMVKK